MEIKTHISATFALGFAVLIVVLSTLTSCHKNIKPTAIQIEDSIRHYPATILGQKLVMLYEVRNLGPEMLVLTDVQPAVPTIEVDEWNVEMIPPGETALLKFTFHSDKNIGLARHIIRVYGNIYPNGVANIIFDTNIVRPSYDLSDYEEYYEKKLQTEAERLLGQRVLSKEYRTDTVSDGKDRIKKNSRYYDITIE